MPEKLVPTRLAASVLLGLLAGCTADRPTESPRLGAARVGRQRIFNVHLYENHSSALIAWREDGVRERVVVHLDAHADLDWLPDETIARIAASLPDELSELEMRPYALDGTEMSRFSSRNFLYPAARLGIVRELFWVVPDGTFEDPSFAERLALDVLVGGMQMVTEEEAKSLRVEGKRIRGRLLGLPVTICELEDLPDLEEPVLLDIDLDFFTTRSAIDANVGASPWIFPRAVIEALGQRGIRTDVVTVSLSTMGGCVPPESRWLGRALQERLRSPSKRLDEEERQRVEAGRAEAAGDLDGASRLYNHLLQGRQDDATLWYALARVEESSGRALDASKARERAQSLDPLFAYADLFQGDREWVNGRYEAALVGYGRYLERFSEGPFHAYAMQRRAGCLLRLQRTEEALEALRRVVEAAPEHPDSRLELGSILRDRGELSEAIRHLRIAKRVLPDVATYRMALGSIYLLEGRRDEGVRLLEEAVERRPCYTEARARLASALFEMGRFEESAEHLRVALVMDGQNSQLRLLAMKLRKRGARVDEASARP